MDTRIQLNEVKQSWKPPAELQRSRPREVCLKGAGKVLVVLIFALMIGAPLTGVLLYLHATAGLSERRLLIEQGRVVQGQVIRRWTSRGKETRYWLDYSYQADGLEYQGRTRASRAFWQRLAPGDALPVRYLPSDPQEQLVPGLESPLMPVWVPFLVAFSMTLPSLLLLRRIAMQRRLLSEGRPVPAIITRYRRSKDGKTCYYVFASSSGELRQGRTGPQRNPPPVGGVICVLYEPDRLSHNEMYPLSLVRPVSPTAE